MKPLPKTRMESSSEYINRVSREYGLYVLDSRSIPQVTDGLKTSQRIAMWLMRSKASKIKTIALAGEMISSNLYVHGDAAAADAISLLAAVYNNNECLLKGTGAFGTRTAPVDGIGAPRYTYVHRSKFAQDVLYTDIEITPQMENYDGSAHMPSTFLPMIPLVLLNGVKGIATGWSTNILPRTFETLRQAVLEVLETGDVITELTPGYNKYDVDIIKTDPGRYIIIGKLEIKNTTTVVVTELPPDVSIESFRDRLNTLEENGKITSYVDKTTDKVNVTIKFKRADLAKHTVASLIEFLKVRSVQTERLVVLEPGGKSVRQYESAEQLVVEWVAWRLEWYLTRYTYLLKKEHERSLFWMSMLACYEPLDDSGLKPLYQILDKIDGKQELKERIREYIKAYQLEVDENVVERISNLATYKWTKEGYGEIISNLEDSEKKMELYTGIINSNTKRKNIFKKEVRGI